MRLTCYLKMTLALAFCGLLLAGDDAFGQGKNNKVTVVNGKNAEPMSYPFFCALTDATGSNSAADFAPFCGASLIAPQWVLTAGHCVLDPMSSKDQLLDSIDVIVAPYMIGEANVNSVRRHSNYIAKHKRFTLGGTDLSYDVALIHLSEPVKSAPIQLTAQGDISLSQAGTPVTGIGYGINDTATYGTPDILQMVNINVLDRDYCNAENRYNGAILNGMICAGTQDGPPTGNAAGDSGGPLFAKSTTGAPVQVGLVSWGNRPFSTAEFPGVYTEIASYRSWIDSIITAYESSSRPTGIEKTARMQQPSLVQTGRSLTLNFNQALPAPASCAVYDMTGRMVASQSISQAAAKISIDLPTVAAGIYTLRMAVANGGESFAYKINMAE